MKKLFLMFTIFLAATSFGNAQEEVQEGGGSGDFGIMAGYTVSTSSIFGLQGAWLSTGDGIFGGAGFVSSLGGMLTIRYNNAELLTNDRLAASLDFTPNLYKGIYLVAGAGYGQYVYPYSGPFQPNLEISGFEWNVGLMVRFFKKVTINAGMSTLNNERNDYSVGVGYIF